MFQKVLSSDGTFSLALFIKENKNIKKVLDEKKMLLTDKNNCGITNKSLEQSGNNNEH